MTFAYTWEFRASHFLYLIKNLILRKADDKVTCHKLLASKPRMKCNNATTLSHFSKKRVRPQKMPGLCILNLRTKERRRQRLSLPYYEIYYDVLAGLSSGHLSNMLHMLWLRYLFWNLFCKNNKIHLNFRFWSINCINCFVRYSVMKVKTFIHSWLFAWVDSRHLAKT